MDSQETFSHLLEYLEYSSSPNLVLKENTNENIPSEIEMSWREAKNKLGLDALYFVGDTPVIYFKRFDAINYERIAEFHRNVWSQCKIPLIFVILPDDIRVYSGYEAPKRNSANTPVEPTRLENKLPSTELKQSNNLWERLSIFTRLAIESGSFWRDYGDQKYFQSRTRADQRLIANLRHVRKQLLQAKPKIKQEYIHDLIARSIFALYLEDRGVLTTDGFFTQNFEGKYSRFTDLLMSHEDTYTFFHILHERFNGDMFITTDEEKNAVKKEHLTILRKLFTEDRGQLLFFWAYNFEFIPIELISSIYEEFLHEEDGGIGGAYYTPPILVDFMLNQVLPHDDQNYKLRVLDPACGSGIFLVEAYKRLVERRFKAGSDSPTPEELLYVLQNSVFGVDKKRQALRVAAFSLCLAMLDYIEPKVIREKVRLPTLIGTNLIKADFFEEWVFKESKFDLVVGNPPWESQLTSYARVFLLKRKYEVGDKQIAQAFLLHAPDFCLPSGQIALLCSSKILLFNRSSSNIYFRKAFFRKFAVTRVFDFSALRRFLFAKATAPAAAIFYKAETPNTDVDIFYGAPKLTQLARIYNAVVIEDYDLKQLPVQQVIDSMDAMSPVDNQNEENEDINSEKETVQPSLFSSSLNKQIISKSHLSINIWKVALWGTSYDYILLQKFKHYKTLGEVLQERKKQGWDFGAGFIRAADQTKYKTKSYPWLSNASYLDAEDFTRYGIDTRYITTLPENRLYQKGRRQKLFQAPLVLFKRGQEGRRPGATFLNQNCTYTSGITGIAGNKQDANLLKALTALLNSDFAQYFWFLTGTSWGIEREEITPGELYTLPFPFLEASEEQIVSIAGIVDELSQFPTGNLEEELEEMLNMQIYTCFGLDNTDIQIIRQTVQHTIKFFHYPKNSLAQDKPTLEMQELYARAYVNAINFYLEPVGKKLSSIIYFDKKNDKDPLRTVRFSLHEQDNVIPDVQIISPDDNMRKALAGLHQLDMEPLPGRMYHRRHYRIYDYNNDGETFYIIKPAEKRLWTISASYADVDETIAELM